MANTTFTDQSTVIEADWLNDVNDVVYDVLGSGVSVPATADEVRQNIGAPKTDGTDATGAWGISITGNAATVTNGVYTSDIGVTVQAYDATLLNDADIGVSVQAYDADTAKLDVAQTYGAGQRGEVTPLTDGASITPNLADSNFFSVTLGGNRTLENPTNIVAGQSGSIFITQDGTGSRTLAYGSYWDFAGGTAPTLSTTASAVDRLDYVVRTSTSIHAVLTKGWA